MLTDQERVIPEKCGKKNSKKKKGMRKYVRWRGRYPLHDQGKGLDNDGKKQPRGIQKVSRYRGKGQL